MAKSEQPASNLSIGQSVREKGFVRLTIPNIFMKPIYLFTFVLFFLVYFPLLSLDTKENKKLIESATEEEDPQGDLRESKRIFIGGFVSEVKGYEFSWFQFGYNFNRALSLSFLYFRRSSVNHFDLDLSGASAYQVSYSLENRDFSQDQIGLALDWFPFNYHHYFTLGLGQEIYNQKDKKQEFQANSNRDWDISGKMWSYSIYNRRDYVSIGTGERLITSSGIFINCAVYGLFFLNNSPRIRRELPLFYNQVPDSAALKKISDDPGSQESKRNESVELSVFISIGISI